MNDDMGYGRWEKDAWDCSRLNRLLVSASDFILYIPLILFNSIDLWHMVLVLQIGDPGLPIEQCKKSGSK